MASRSDSPEPLAGLAAAARAGLLAVLLGAPAAPAADWPQWRGPDRNGITREHSGWDGTNWNVRKVWQVNVGDGMGTSPLLVDGRVYVMGNASSTDTVWCLDVRNGGVLWKQTYPCPYKSRCHYGDPVAGPFSTPTLDKASGYLYTLSCDADLNCWDTRNLGSNVWHVNFYDAYGIDQRYSTAVTDPARDYGYSSCPLLLGDCVVVEVGDENAGNIMGFDKRTGARVWMSEDRHDAGHSCGPVLVTVGGVPCLASFTLEGLRIMRADAGHEGTNVAWYPWVMPYNVGCPTPAVSGNTVALTSTADYSSGKQTTFLQVGPGGITNQWLGQRQSYICSPVLHKGYLYTVDAQLHCLNAATGAFQWEGGSALSYWNNGSVLVTGDEKVLAWGRNCLILAESAPYSGGSYRELAKIASAIASASLECYPHVTLAEGWILVKDKAGRLAGYSVGPVDADRDGMPDGWELNYFGSTNHPDGTATADWDADGLSNLGEYIAGTNPTNPASVWTVTDLSAPGAADIAFRWSSVSGRYYSVYSRTNLASASWSTSVTRRFSTSDGVMAYTNSDGAPRQFFRVGVQQE